VSVRKEYFINGPARLKPEDARVIGPVLQELADAGPVTARDVVETAHSANSPLHSYFEWDDKKAADPHRIGTARDIIRTVRVRVTSSDGEEKGLAAQRVTVRAVQTVAKGGAWRKETAQTTVAASSTQQCATKMRQAHAALKDWAHEYRPFFTLWERFSDTFADVRESIEALDADEFGVPKVRRRFTDHAPMAPERVRGLQDDNAAVNEARTLFPSTVVDPADSPALLVSGANSRKLGDRVTKGPWSGFPIYQLSLEERATCPRSCFHWSTCYGNGMQMARRHRNTPDLIPYLRAELTDLQDELPGGFVVRLHVLGDFYSLEYVQAWRDFLAQFPALHVFGYTAWPKDSDIGNAINLIASDMWDRFAIRFSSADPQPQGATTIWRIPEDDTVHEGIVCPAQTDKTDCCGTCGLCWAVAAKDKTIAFIAHGPKAGPRSEGPIRQLTREQLMRGRA